MRDFGESLGMSGEIAEQNNRSLCQHGGLRQFFAHHLLEQLPLRNRLARRHVLEDDGVRADFRTRADDDRAQDFGAAPMKTPASMRGLPSFLRPEKFRPIVTPWKILAPDLISAGPITVANPWIISIPPSIRA
ncbi:hypothetical protein GE107_20155 [Cohnella sp. CFH 77786]|uniref:hypothetical protein n=1 Tax=Cohnella sp. CFH 77786 TaxID=2662265 RepID=UPI001C60E19C|nr:hypothetical protein [Cohnella sp. CFH 77786]MBW5448360.1 hypothetical protein [Cohnella sp. CFH 77786]